MNEAKPKYTLKNPAPTSQPDWDPNPDRVVETYQSLAYGLAKGFKQTGVPLDDLRQEALIGLLEAARNYRPEKGASFTTYATFWIRKRLLRAAREESAASQTPPPGHTTGIQTESDTPSSDSANLRLPSGLDPLERQILLLSLRDELPLKEIATRTGLSVERVKQLRAKALRRIRSTYPPSA